MPTEELTYREGIKSTLDNMNERMKTFEHDTSSSLERILEQVSRTNGRVSKLENWRAYLSGGLAVLSLIMLGVLIPLVSAWLGK